MDLDNFDEGLEVDLYNVSVCVKDDHVKLQFRWLNTAHHTNLTRDVAILDDVTVIGHNCTQNITLLEDNFDSESQIWIK